MSAVAGLVGLDDRPIGKSDLHGAMGILAPLVPGHGSSGGAGASGGIWAGSAGRLGVAVGAVCRVRVAQDVTAVQPVLVAGGQVVVVADVILDNRADLCRELRLADTDDLADAELVGYAYLEWGRQCASRMVGEFAFAVVDRRCGGVLLVRDQIGNRPLHVYEDAGRLCFASTALAVTGFSGVPAEIDLQRVKEYLAALITSEHSWIRDVRPVPPATAMWITKAGIESEVYWHLDATPRNSACFDDFVEELREVFDQSVRCRLRGMGGLGVMLSGGLDSTSVAATVATMTGSEPVRTYTSVPPPGWNGPVFPGREADESAMVFAMAERYPSLRPTLVDAKGQSVFRADDDLYVLGGTPVRNILNTTWIRAIHERAAMDGVGRMFTGELGNSAFSADDQGWLVSLLRRGRVDAAVREVRAWSRVNELSLVRTAVHFGLLEVAPEWLGRAVHRLVRSARNAQATEFSVLQSDIGRTDTPFVFGRDGIGRSRALIELGIRGVASNAHTRAAMEAKWGCRRVDPTADLRLLQSCATQPSWARRRHGHSRAVARAAMVGRLPDVIRLRKVRGQQSADWLDRATDAFLEFSGELAAAGHHETSRMLLDVERLGTLTRNWPHPDRATESRVAVQYMLMLPAALAASHYLRWFETWAKHRSQHSGAAGSLAALRLEVR